MVRASEAAALRSEEAAAGALRRKDARPVTADEEPFTAAWHHAVRSMETTQVTATSSLAGLAAAATRPPGLTFTPSTSPAGTGTPRASRRHARVPHTSVTKLTVTGKYDVIVYAPWSRSGAVAGHCDREEGNSPAARGTARQTPATRGPFSRSPGISETDAK